MTVGAPWFGAAGQKAVVFVPRFLPSPELHGPPPPPHACSRPARGRCLSPRGARASFVCTEATAGTFLLHLASAWAQASCPRVSRGVTLPQGDQSFSASALLVSWSGWFSVGGRGAVLCCGIPASPHLTPTVPVTSGVRTVPGVTLCRWRSTDWTERSWPPWWLQSLGPCYVPGLRPEI